MVRFPQNSSRSNNYHRTMGGALLLLLLVVVEGTSSFLHHSSPTISPMILKVKSTKAAASKRKTISSGLKGFGSPSPSSSAAINVGGTVTSPTAIIDRSPSALKFYDYLHKHGAESNLSRVGLGHNTAGLRGVVALRDIKRGDIIMDIPYELAIDLGRENSDPTLPATTFLQKYCAWQSGCGANIPPGDKDRGSYFNMIPPYYSSSSEGSNKKWCDCLGSTDFYSTAALDMLQSPMIVDETIKRKELVNARYDRDILPMATMSSNLYRWKEESDHDDDDDDMRIVSNEHLRWATWVITSRVLTVQGSTTTDESSDSSNTPARRLLIPLIDMCNHDRDSPHILTGRAVSGSLLKVVAGCNVCAGDAITIAYGGGVEGNDRFIQDYGFLDAGSGGSSSTEEEEAAAAVAEGYRIVARKILGKGRAGLSRMTASDSIRELQALSATTLEDDEAFLASGTIVLSDEKMALEYRIGVKRAIRLLQEKEQ